MFVSGPKASGSDVVISIRPRPLFWIFRSRVIGSSASAPSPHFRLPTQPSKLSRLFSSVPMVQRPLQSRCPSRCHAFIYGFPSSPPPLERERGHAYLWENRPFFAPGLRERG